MRPYKLVFSELCDSLKEARQREILFKKHYVREIIKRLISNNVPVASTWR